MRREKSARVKLLGDNRIGGYLAVFGDPEHRDLEGDYFTPETNFWLDTYKSQPLIFDHALQPLPDSVDSSDTSDYQFGVTDKIEVDDIGVWVEGIVTRRAQWVDAVLNLIDKGEMNWSSGSVPHLVVRASDGWLKSWPIVEGSVTPTPAEPRQTDVVRLKYYAGSKQDEQRDAREVLPSEGSQGGSGEPDTHLSTNKHTPERTIMDLEKFLKGYVVGNWADIKATYLTDGTVKQGILQDALQPLADQIAEMAGAPAEEILAKLIEIVAGYAAGEAAPAEEEIVTEEPMPEGMTLSIDNDDLDRMVNERVQKALQAALPEHAGGGFRAKTGSISIITPKDRPLSFGQYLKAIRDGRGDEVKRMQAGIRNSYKALGINPDTAGGYLVPVEQNNQMIELLRSESVVMPLCRQIPMNSDTLTIPRTTGGTTTYWTGENAQLTAADPTFGQLQLVAKKLTVLVKISNELLNDSSPAIDAIIREDIARAAASEIDRVILEGSGLGSEPLGVANAGCTTTALNAAATYANLNDADYRVMVENVANSPDWAWVVHPRELHNFRELEDTAGSLIWASAAGYGQPIAGAFAGTLLGHPIYKTTEITIDTANNNETRIYFGQWDDVVVGMRQTLTIEASAQAGTSFEYDQTWIRAILRMDVGVRHPESIEILTDVRDS